MPNRFGIKYIVTGMPRSGTAYISKLFQSAGINMGHENIFRPDGINLLSEHNSDASWLAVPRLKQMTEVERILIVRDPIKVLNSNYNRGVLERGNEFDIFAERNVSQLGCMTSYTDKLIWFYIQWHAMALPHIDKIFNIEEITENPHSFFQKLGIDTTDKELFNDKKKNGSEYETKITWENIEKSVFKNLFQTLTTDLQWKGSFNKTQKKF